MIKNDKIGLIFSMELKKFLNSKKTFLIAFILPIFLVSFIIISTTDLDNNTENSTIGIVNNNISISPLINTYESKNDSVISYYTEQSLKDDLLSSKCGAGILIDEEISIIYDSLSAPSDTVIKEATHIAEELNMSIIGEDVYNSFINSRPQINKLDISTDNARTISEFQMILMMLSIIIIMITALNIITLSSDSITGDKERGTFDSLRLSKTSITTILFGKSIFVVSIAFIIMAISVIAGIISMKLFTPKLFNDLASYIPNNTTWIISIILMLLSMSLIATAIFTLISSFFGKVKHATSYSSIGLLVLSLSSMLPSYIDLELWDYIPFVNTTSIILSVLRDEDYLVKAAIGLIIGLLAYVVLVLVSSHIVQKEAKS